MKMNFARHFSAVVIRKPSLNLCQVKAQIVAVERLKVDRLKICQLIQKQKDKKQKLLNAKKEKCMIEKKKLLERKKQLESNMEKETSYEYLTAAKDNLKLIEIENKTI